MLHPQPLKNSINKSALNNSQGCYNVVIMYNCVILSDTDQSQITELFNSPLWSSEQHISQQSHDMTHSSEHFNILHSGLVY